LTPPRDFEYNFWVIIVTVWRRLKVAALFVKISNANLNPAKALKSSR
jgi:hypothetical protein